MIREERVFCHLNVSYHRPISLAQLSGNINSLIQTTRRIQTYIPVNTPVLRCIKPKHFLDTVQLEMPVYFLKWAKIAPHDWQIGSHKHSVHVVNSLLHTPQLISHNFNAGVMHQIWQKATWANSQPHSMAIQIPQHKVEIM